MAYVSSPQSADAGSAGRPMVAGLFVASCLLSIVSWYTTMQGMALYLSTWFALLASIGVQAALVLVAWLVGFSKSKRGLLVAVYVITAIVSVAFSYVSLYTWFSTKERPALVQRQLYDRLNETSQKTEGILSGAIAEQRKHILALEEMTEAEKSHGFISRAQDTDPYLAKVRESVAEEAKTYGGVMREGSGEGLRYTAFDRYTKLARQSLTQIEASQRAMFDFRAQTKPLDPTDKQLQGYHQAFDPIPWSEVEGSLHTAKVEKPPVPNYTDFVDHSVSGQEDLMLAFTELFTAPTPRHAFSFALAAFIDVIIFLLAYSSGPYFAGSDDQRWRRAAAVLDATDEQVFTRDLLRKVLVGGNGTMRLDSADLSPGERQFCLLLVGKGLAATIQEEGRLYYMLDAGLHESMLDSMATQRMPLRAAQMARGAGAGIS